MFMNRFTTGLIAGSVLGAAGMVMMANDKKGRRRMMRDGRKFVSKASNVVEDIAQMMK